MSRNTSSEYFVYVLSNRVRTLYVGVTNNLERRILEHRRKLVKGFTGKYNVNWLVHYEQTHDVVSAISREKEIKGWSRHKKVAMIERFNPTWKDLSRDWYADYEPLP